MSFSQRLVLDTIMLSLRDHQMERATYERFWSEGLTNKEVEWTIERNVVKWSRRDVACLNQLTKKGYLQRFRSEGLTDKEVEGSTIYVSVVEWSYRDVGFRGSFVTSHTLGRFTHKGRIIISWLLNDRTPYNFSKVIMTTSIDGHCI